MENINLSKAFTALVCATVLLSLPSCHDEVDYIPETPVADGLKIYIPNVEGAALFGTTRADEFANPNALAEASDGEINSLWLLAIPKQSGGEPVYVHLENPGGDEPSQASDADYKTYTVSNSTLKEGETYYLYLLGNLDAPGHEYVSENNIKSLATKAQADALVLGFDPDNIPLTPGYLPMACTPEKIRLSKNGDALPDGEFTFTANSAVYADLSFLCAKVRYTIFFDNTPSDGYSYPGFKTSYLTLSTFSDSGTHPYASNVRKTTSLLEPASSSDIPFLPGTPAMNLEAVRYPGDGNDADIETYPRYDTYTQGSDPAYPVSTTTGSVEGNLPTLSSTGASGWTDTHKRAWQGVAYLPENKVTADATSDSRTIITFPATIDGEALTYTLPLLPDNSVISRPTRADDSAIGYGIRRSTLYDVVIKVETSQNWNPTVLESDWDILSLAYRLHGPYELEVESTQISVSSGKQTTLWYRSNVSPENIGFNVPTLTTSSGTYNFYEVELTEDSLIGVRINANIPYSELPEESQISTLGLDYFEVTAGNIVKRIDVKSVSLAPSLEIGATDLVIDVAEHIKSGVYNTELTIEFFTNVDGLKLTQVGASGDYETFPLQSGDISLMYGDTRITSSEFTFPGDPKEGELKVVVNNFNNGSDYWKSDHTYKMIFSVPKVDGNLPEDVEITVTVKKFTTDYIIHFKTDNAWNNPHIYVYQCLALPSHIPDWTNDGTTYSYKDREGKPVGYRYKENYLAALEYNFTSCVAFKGWRNFGNDNDDCYTDPRADGSGSASTQGFWVFNFKENAGHWTYGRNSDQLYIPFNDDGSYKYNEMESYITNVHFNKSHIDRMGTTTCCGEGTYSDIDPYPGIRMEPEGDGWWRYTLTGVATPGKALIIFSDGHGNGSRVDTRRYPGDAQVGLPLFDFADHEGWFYYTGNCSDGRERKFEDNKPANTATVAPVKNCFEKGDKVRIYWYKNTLNGSEDYHCLYAYPESDIANSKGWPGFVAGNDGVVTVENGNGFYVDIVMGAYCKEFNVIIHNNKGENNPEEKRRVLNITFDSVKDDTESGCYVSRYKFW